MAVLLLALGWAFLPARTDHAERSNNGVNQRSSKPITESAQTDPFADIAKTPTGPAASGGADADPYRVTRSRHSTGDKVISCPVMRGHGLFTFKNDSEDDAVVFLMADATNVAASIYIRESENGVLRNIKPGRYWVKIAKGKGWDSERRSFTSDRTYFKVPHPYDFSETEEENAVRYSTVELTLYKVLDGNVEQESIWEAEFAGK